MKVNNAYQQSFIVFYEYFSFISYFLFWLSGAPQFGLGVNLFANACRVWKLRMVSMWNTSRIFVYFSAVPLVRDGEMDPEPAKYLNRSGYFSLFQTFNSKKKLKAGRPHPRYYPHTPPDYRHTDKHLRLVMTFIALCCTRQSWAPNIDCCVPEIWPWHWPRPLTLTLDFDLDL